jgi:plastocyanin
MKGYKTADRVGVGRRPPTLILAASALLLVALVVAACGQAASTVAPAVQPTAVVPTSVPAAAATSVPEAAAIIPSVTVADQAIVEDSVTIAQVVSDGPGWLIVHADNSGQPGPVLGYSLVSDGENKDVVIRIDVSDATQTVYAMLHSDGGTVGSYEFPGSDGPVLVGEQMVSPAFRITGGLTEAPVANPTAAPGVSTSGASPTVALGEAEIELEDNQARPQVLTVGVGTRVKFGNRDAQARIIRSDSGAFTSGTLQKGEEFFYTFTQAGEYLYYSDPGGGPGGQGLSGTIIVVPEGAASPSSTPAVAPTTVGGVSPTVAVGEAEVELEDNQARPQVLTVKAGTRVKFGNRDEQARVIRSDTEVFTSGVLKKGEEFTYTFTQAGEYPYYSDPGGGPGGQGLSGKIIVVPQAR